MHLGKEGSVFFVGRWMVAWEVAWHCDHHPASMGLSSEQLQACKQSQLGSLCLFLFDLPCVCVAPTVRHTKQSKQRHMCSTFPVEAYNSIEAFDIWFSLVWLRSSENRLPPRKGAALRLTIYFMISVRMPCFLPSPANRKQFENRQNETKTPWMLCGLVTRSYFQQKRAHCAATTEATLAAHGTTNPTRALSPRLFGLVSDSDRTLMGWRSSFIESTQNKQNNLSTAPQFGYSCLTIRHWWHIRYTRYQICLYSFIALFFFR